MAVKCLTSKCMRARHFTKLPTTKHVNFNHEGRSQYVKLLELSDKCRLQDGEREGGGVESIFTFLSTYLIRACLISLRVLHFQLESELKGWLRLQG